MMDTLETTVPYMWDDPFALPPLATVVLDRWGTVTSWSPAAQRLLGYTPEQVLGRPAMFFLHQPVDVVAVYAAVDRCQADGDWGGLLPARHADGHRVDVGLRVCSLIDSPDGRSWLLLASDVAQTRWWGADLSVLDGLLSRAPIAMAVLDTDLREVWLNDALEQRGGISRARRLGRRPTELMASPSLERIEAQMRQVLKTGVPLLDVGYQGRTSGDSDRELATSTSIFRLADSAGCVLGLCYVSVDVTDRWRAQQRLALLTEASTRIGTSLDVGLTAQDLADVAVPRLADFVAVDLLDSVLRSEEPTVRSTVGRTPMRRAGQQSLRAGCPESVAKIGDLVVLAAPAARCLVEGEAVLEPVLDPDRSVWVVDDPVRAAKIHEFGLHSLMLVPIRARGVVTGVASFVRWARPDPFEADDLLLAQEFVARAALCIDNARRYTREHTAALALQRSLLPHRLPGQTAVEVAWHYLPADESAGVGGDWFDVIPLSGARVALVVGDVVGHGLHAAATMGRLRTAVHTLAGLDLPPDELLARLDDLVIRLTDEEDTAAATAGPAVLGATCLYAVYDPVSRICSLARAGHPPPAIVHPDGTVAFPDLPAGPPLGLGGLPFEAGEIELPEGSLIALYTNGLVEARDHDVDAGLGRLRTALGRAEESLEAIREGVIEALLPDRPDDDVALLLARTRTLTADQVASWDLPADFAVVALARAHTARQLALWGFDEAAFITELLVSELVTNAIRYAAAPIRLRLIRDRTLICEVSDGSSTSPRLRHARASDEGGRGLFLVAQFTQRWGARYTAGGKTIWAEQSLFPSEAELVLNHPLEDTMAGALGGVWDAF
nr:SpoIIE family protein phosphatase [Frankia sp. Cas3]